MSSLDARVTSVKSPVVGLPILLPSMAVGCLPIEVPGANWNRMTEIQMDEKRKSLRVMSIIWSKRRRRRQKKRRKRLRRQRRGWWRRLRKRKKENIHTCPKWFMSFLGNSCIYLVLCVNIFRVKFNRHSYKNFKTTLPDSFLGLLTKIDLKCREDTLAMWIYLLLYFWYACHKNSSVGDKYISCPTSHTGTSGHFGDQY